MNADIKNILDIIEKKCGKDMSVYSESFLEKTIVKRLSEISSTGVGDYPDYLISEPGEIDIILDSFNISYSLFFRSSLDFSILEQLVFPEIFQRKESGGSKAARMWSAGCAQGQELYSLLMLADKLINDRSQGFSVMAFGTDISGTALKKAEKGDYDANSLQNMSLSYITKYFNKTDNKYELHDSIKKKADFSYYDMLDNASATPPSSIYGEFDFIACCNLLIYYKPEAQRLILEKLYRSLSDKGYLLVDFSEKTIVKSHEGFRLFAEVGNIFIKQ